MSFRAVFGTLFLLVAAAAWAGKYKLAADAASAEFHAESSSDSTGTTLRTVMAWASADAIECKADKHGEYLGRDMHNKVVGKTPTVRIAAGEAFTLTIKYDESRMGETRQCAVTGTFTPAAGRRYLGRIEVIDNTDHCNLGVYDITDGVETKVETSLPGTMSCARTADGRMPNGLPILQKF